VLAIDAASFFAFSAKKI